MQVCSCLCRAQKIVQPELQVSEYASQTQSLKQRMPLRLRPTSHLRHPGTPASVGAHASLRRTKLLIPFLGHQLCRAMPQPNMVAVEQVRRHTCAAVLHWQAGEECLQRSLQDVQRRVKPALLQACTQQSSRALPRVSRKLTWHCCTQLHLMGSPAGGAARAPAERRQGPACPCGGPFSWEAVRSPRPLAEPGVARGRARTARLHSPRTSGSCTRAQTPCRGAA